MFGSITPVVKNLIILNLIVFLGSNVLGLFPLEYLRLYVVGTENFEPYQLVASFFTHDGLGHIFWNMFLLYVFGSFLEQWVGPKAFGIIYLSAGVGGILLDQFIHVYNQDLMVASVGASGAVMGILAAAATLDPDKEFYFFMFPVKLIWVAILMIGKDVYSVLVQSPYMSDGIAHWIHLGGALTGFLMIKFWYRKFS